MNNGSKVICKSVKSMTSSSSTDCFIVAVKLIKVVQLSGLDENQINSYWLVYIYKENNKFYDNFAKYRYWRYRAVVANSDSVLNFCELLRLAQFSKF